MALAHPTGGQALVICSDGAEATIYIDASGNLTDPPTDCSKCPECMDNSGSALAADGHADKVLQTRSARWVRLGPDCPLPCRHLRPQSRGPPEWTRDRTSPALEATRMPCAPSLHTGSCDLRERVAQSTLS
jgi:hypothetical protein